jgi:urease accessory protein
MSVRPNANLLALLQVSDSALPIGAYSHSYGLETWVQEGNLQNVSDVSSAILTLLKYSIAPQQGIACTIARQCALANDYRRFVGLNQILSASNWAKETRQASLQMGARLARLSKEIGWLDNTNTNFSQCSQAMHHAAVYGWLSALLRIDELESVSAYLYGCCASMTSACLRLVPLGHTEAQKMLAGLHTEITDLAQTCLGKSEAEMHSFAPMNERACVEHESLYSRLFQS